MKRTSPKVVNAAIQALRDMALAVPAGAYLFLRVAELLGEQQTEITALREAGHALASTRLCRAAGCEHWDRAIAAWREVTQ